MVVDVPQFNAKFSDFDLLKIGDIVLKRNNLEKCRVREVKSQHIENSLLLSGRLRIAIAMLYFSGRLDKRSVIGR